jgi:hypothetical protein
MDQGFIDRGSVRADHWHGGNTMRLLSQLVLVLTVVLASLTLPARALPSAAQEATPASLAAGTPTPFLGETYVGETSDPNTFIAVVVAEAEGDGGARQARAYLCNATTIDVWLTGTLTGEQLALQAEDGARLEGTLGDAGVEGMTTLADGMSLPFTAQPATGIAGLYTVTFEAEGRVHGVSATGGQLDGRVEADAGTPGASPAAGAWLVMTLTSPEGETAELEAAVIPSTRVEAGTARLIVLEDGQVRGKRTKDTKGDQGFIDPTSDL